MLEGSRAGEGVFWPDDAQAGLAVVFIVGGVSLRWVRMKKAQRPVKGFGLGELAGINRENNIYMDSAQIRIFNLPCFERANWQLSSFND